ncbi:MAG: cupin domain-containing protein [Burkholderiales bacterium]|nr:cupin domain-containing protein [Burkholderiales bacterium]
MTRTLLGGLTPRAFLARHWQKKALLARNAIPAFDGFLDRDALFQLAGRDDVESRLVVRSGRRWELRHGPFRRTDFRDLPARNWTLLVQGVNLHVAAGAALLARFDFIPHARLDDLMVSYAAPGGGVGPHFDSYDVFLLQGFGRRRWRTSRQRDLDLIPGAPLKLLRRFEPEETSILGPGDMLYLPPRYAHDGVALEACTTYSIGFRAPALRELASQFFMDLAERLDLEGLYADPDLRPSRSPGRIGTDLIRATGAALDQVRWGTRDVEDFLGRYLTEPKSHVFFAPQAPMRPSVFATALARGGIELNRKSLMLHGSRAVYLNGDAARFPRGVPALLRALADRRRLDPIRPEAPLLHLLHEWHSHGYLEPAAPEGATP